MEAAKAFRVVMMNSTRNKPKLKLKKQQVQTT
jgi:hypothetical protein